MTWGSPTLTGEGAPSRLAGQKITASYLDVLGVQPRWGDSLLRLKRGTRWF